jgi:hypothetical protein
LLAWFVVTIDNEHYDIGSSKLRNRHRHGDTFRLLVDPSPTPNASGVDKDVLFAAVLESGVYRVGGCARNIVNQGALCTQEAIDERRFARIGLAYKCDAQGPLGRKLFGRSLFAIALLVEDFVERVVLFFVVVDKAWLDRQLIDNRLDKVIDAASMSRRDWIGSAHP